ncbi:DCC1 [Candida jiufengensis]|uniref:DCC1 n=1 Tax=Candida jiufengensis TaxID=497108 RepID=UPI0022249F94|nr:DCC1 [Candida jiufengensis]KAI5949561.1 DCC1 [Candida jiufengensis]
MSNKIEVYQQLRPNDNYTYKLIQIPPQTITHLQNSNNLQLKTTKENSNVLLTTTNKTFRMRQNNHSNTILLMNHEFFGGGGSRLVGYDKCFYQYEINEIPGLINDELNIPILENEKDIEKISGRRVTKNELFEKSPCSLEEFELKWIELNFIEFNSKVFKISFSLITEILFDLITYLISTKSTDYEFVKDEIVIDHLSILVESIILKFTTEKNGKYKLNNEKIISWFGIIELTKSKQLKLNDFYLNWKNSLPSFYNFPLDLLQIKGNYVTYIHQNNQYIKYINPANLSKDVNLRFKQLLSIQSIWKYEELCEFFDDFIKVGKKIDSTILKFGKKKKISGGKFIVTGR